jgi:hypothetical protein
VIGHDHPYWRRRGVLLQAWREWWTPFAETPLFGRTVLQLSSYE